MRINFVDLKMEYETIKPELDNAIQKIINNTQFILGNEVDNFEQNFAEFNNTKHCVGVSSGTESIKLALEAVGVQPGDEVITTPNTFIATTYAISALKAIPKFVDIDKDTHNMDPTKLQSTITEKTKAIVPVHLFGQSADMDPILEIANKHNLKVVEDACQSHGAKYKNKTVGTMGDIGCFSFYPGKNIGAFGDAGAIITNNEEYSNKIKLLRNYGQEPKHNHLIKGYNNRMDALHAAILIVKLRFLEHWNSERKRNAKFYEDRLKDTNLILPITKENNDHVFHLYVIRSKDRDKIQQHLTSKEIATGIHYPVPIHLQPAYKELNLKEGSFPIAEQYAKEILSLPIYPELPEHDIDEICNEIKSVIS